MGALMAKAVLRTALSFRDSVLVYKLLRSTGRPVAFWKVLWTRYLLERSGIIEKWESEK